eukprot:TRINITY_DN43187_c0_g1_i3.p3 TRINITY_DN43187_c0_g1~~TRINITY_DN43187_c0_g1_i3.p3  ORF type:complete len:127 (-),score=18.25 TRINITY_DN43187_c0_g1_i3:20-400(-)
MKIVIATKGTMAIYEQIVSQLKTAIVTKELKPGEALPSIRVLANELQVSVITTKRAYEELEKEGLIRSVAGKGLYAVSYTHLRAHETSLHLVCRLLLEKKKNHLLSTLYNSTKLTTLHLQSYVLHQ